MKKVIIFGAGAYGNWAYYKLKENREIAYYVDNNSIAHGTKFHDIPIISASELEDIYSSSAYDIIVCVKEYQQIVKQLADMGIVEYYVMQQGLLYYSNTVETMIPVEPFQYKYYKKEPFEKNILFVQNTACIRTHKIASLMKKSGYKVFLLYTNMSPELNNAEFVDVYDNIYTVFTLKGVVDFVENSDFDIVHSSNEPDVLTNLLLMTKKHIVFDTHDMMSLRRPESIENLTLEHIANTASDGNIYTSNPVVEIAKKKFGLEDKEILAWENIVLEQEEINTTYQKLSSIDGELHCVYEGGVVGSNKLSHRFFEDIWDKIVNCGIHIHFYSQSDYKYCKELEKKSNYLHYEGNLGTKALIQEMTKYDCGLAIFNVNSQNKVFLETGTANKVYEYLNAGLPVVVGDVQSYIDFVERYGVGKRLDMEQDINEQIKAISQITIEEDFLTKNKLTMMSRNKEIIDFYERVKQRQVTRWN